MAGPLKEDRCFFAASRLALVSKLYFFLSFFIELKKIFFQKYESLHPIFFIAVFLNILEALFLPLCPSWSEKAFLAAE